MTTPPGYGDLGKAARDLFSKGFNYGKYNLEIKTKSAMGVEFKASGNNNHDSGKIGGNLETKLKCSEYNIQAKEIWSTDNTLGTEIEFNDPARGLKLVTEGGFNPQSGKKSGKIKSNYKREYLNTSCDVDLDPDGPVIHGSAVTEYKGWLAGYQMAFDTAKSALSRNNFAFGFKAEGTELHTSVNDGTEFGASIYQKVNEQTDFGTELAWSSEASTTKFGVALKYLNASGSVYRAKLNNAMQIGLSYQHEMSKGVTMTVSTLIEGNSINAGGHKMGFGLEMDL